MNSYESVCSLIWKRAEDLVDLVGSDQRGGCGGSGLLYGEMKL